MHKTAGRETKKRRNGHNDRTSHNVLPPFAIFCVKLSPGFTMALLGTLTFLPGGVCAGWLLKGQEQKQNGKSLAARRLFLFVLTADWKRAAVRGHWQTGKKDEAMTLSSSVCPQIGRT